MDENKNNEKFYFNKEHPVFDAFFGGTDKDMLKNYFNYIKNQFEKPQLWMPDVSPLKAGSAANPTFGPKTPDAKTLQELRVAEGEKELSDLMKYCQTPEGKRELCARFEIDRRIWRDAQNYRIMHNLR